MNTVDPQAPYGDKPTERAPLLSEEGLIEVHSTTDFPDTVFVKVRGRKGGFTMPRSAIEFVEGLAAEMEAAIRAKITSGELMVVKKASFEDWRFGKCCPVWHRITQMETGDTAPNFCPGCGAQIVKG